MKSTTWPAPNVWVFMAQMVERCSANAGAMGSNPVDVPIFFRVYFQLLKLHLPLRWSCLYFRSSHYLQAFSIVNYEILLARLENYGQSVE